MNKKMIFLLMCCIALWGLADILQEFYLGYASKLFVMLALLGHLFSQQEPIKQKKVKRK